MEESVGPEPRQWDDTQHTWSGCEHLEVPAEDGQLRAIHMNGVWTCKALFKAGRLACDVCYACGKEPETQSHMWRCQNEQYAVI